MTDYQSVKVGMPDHGCPTGGARRYTLGNCTSRRYKLMPGCLITVGHSCTSSSDTCNMRFSPFFRATQSRAGDGQAEGSIILAPSRGERRGQQGQATSKLWPGCGCCCLRQALAEKKGLATDVGDCRRALARWGMGRRGRQRAQRPADAPRGMADWHAGVGCGVGQRRSGE
jgi:hypothetical protein